jgi:hypothetical protein
MKTEVYSWRVSAELKSDLECAARQRRISLSAALDLAAREWLSRTDVNEDDLDRQQQLHRASEKLFGSITPGESRRSERVSELMRGRLRRQHGR